MKGLSRYKERAYGGFIFVFTTFYGLFFRRRFVNMEVVRSLVEEGGKVIATMWHQRIFLMVCMRKSIAPSRPAVIVSASKDGEILATAIELMGLRPVRGSSSFRGKQAMGEIIADLQRNPMALHGVDGPTGPAMAVKAGIIRMAQKTGAAVLPVYLSSSRAWKLKSWDAHIIPKPFSRILLRWGEPFFVPAELTPEEFEKKRRELEGVMIRGQELLDMECEGKTRR